MTPRPDTEHSKAWYDALSGYYDVLVDPFQARFRRRGIEWLDLSGDVRVLAVGCGTGRGAATLGDAVGPGGRVVGIDVAEGMCHRTRDRLADDARSAAICGDARALPFDPDSFDAVLVSFTLELFDDDHRTVVLGEISRVLAPRGRLCVVAPTTVASDVVPPLYRWLNDTFPTVVDSRPLDVSGVLGEAGFEVLRTDIEWAAVVPIELVVARRG